MAELITNRRLRRKALRKYGTNINPIIAKYINIVRKMKYANNFVIDEYSSDDEWKMIKCTSTKKSFYKSGICLTKDIDGFKLRLGVDYKKYLTQFNICHKLYLQIIARCKHNYNSTYQEYYIHARFPGFVLVITDNIKIVYKKYEEIKLCTFYKYSIKKWVTYKEIITLKELISRYPDLFKQYILTKSAAF